MYLVCALFFMPQHILMDSATSDEGTSVDAAVLQSKVLNDVGTIKIEVYGTVKRKIQTQKPNDSPEKGVCPPVVVSERLVKGKVMHQIACVDRPMC
jgi:hypothetical protein